MTNMNIRKNESIANWENLFALIADYKVIATAFAGCASAIAQIRKWQKVLDYLTFGLNAVDATKIDEDFRLLYLSTDKKTACQKIENLTQIAVKQFCWLNALSAKADKRVLNCYIPRQNGMYDAEVSKLLIDGIDDAFFGKVGTAIEDIDWRRNLR